MQNKFPIKNKMKVSNKNKNSKSSYNSMVCWTNFVLGKYFFKTPKKKIQSLLKSDP